MNTIYVLAAAELIIGILLCLRGLSIYKTVAMLLCGALCGYLGLRLEYLLDKEWLYIVAVVLAVAGAYLGYRHYRITYYISANVIAFLVTFQIYWKKAVATVQSGSDSVTDMKHIIADSLKGNKSLSDMSSSINKIITMSQDNFGKVVKDAADIVRTGLIVALIVAAIAGIFAMWFGDYVVMVVTSAFGSVLMLSCASSFFEIPNSAYLMVLAVIAGLGMYSQIATKRR